MQTYFVRRRSIAAGASELDAALTRLRSFEEQSSTLPVRWLHSYALRESDGRFGLACLFQAESAQSLRLHADLVRLPAAEILPATATQVVRRFAPTLVYLVRRRKFAKDADDLQRGIDALCRIGEEELASEVSWLRTYALRADDGSLGTVCLYQSVDANALREHARRAGIPADEITPVIGRIQYREDSFVLAPATSAASA